MKAGAVSLGTKSHTGAQIGSNPGNREQSEATRLKSQSAEERRDAAEQLGYLEDRSAVEPLIAVLQDSSADVRAAALQYVRKVSGFRAPAAHNQEVFDRAVEAVAQATADLLDGLEVRGAGARKAS